jgi:hypothetical protein
MNKLTPQDELTEFLLYNDGNGDVRVETYLHNETLWLPLAKPLTMYSFKICVAQILNWVALLELTR